MKRPNQLLLESAIVASLILGLTVGGAIAGLNLPSAWTDLPNPSNLPPQYSYESLALLYNTTLTELADQNFTSVSISLGEFSFLNYPPQLGPAMSSANSEISEMNTSIPLAISYLALAKNLTTGGQIPNASSNLSLGCNEAQLANSNYGQFQGVTTPGLANNGVPVLVYSTALGLVGSQISNLLSICSSESSHLKTLQNFTTSDFTITSPQSTLETGGFVQVNGSLKFDATAVANDQISLFLNGTKFASAITDQNGFFSINSSTPFVYKSVAAIWAVASGSSFTSPTFQGAVSNILYMKLIFNQTQISVQDPPAILPTYNFTISGRLTTSSGVSLPDAPIKIISFNEPYLLKTNTSGFFSSSLTVPPDATDGLHTIFASFASQGVFGPAVNFTTIQVIHEVPKIAINPVSVVYSGFTREITGKVVANGTGVASANITLSSPWGKFLTESNATGDFNVGLTVPLSAFWPSNNIIVSMRPSQPFINVATLTSSIAVVNPLDFLFPLLVAGVLVYELRNLGLLRSRKGADDEANEEKGVDLTVQNLMSQVDETRLIPRLVSLYRNSLIIAATKFNLNILPSSTIREIVAQLSSSAQDSGMREFEKISTIFEDYLYAENFEKIEISEAEDAFARLENIWR